MRNRTYEIPVLWSKILREIVKVKGFVIVENYRNGVRVKVNGALFEIRIERV